MNWHETIAFLTHCLPKAAARPLNALPEGSLREIRVRAGQPIRLLTCQGEKLCLCEPTPQQVAQMAEALCEHALYARAEEQRGGFVTLRGGHRMGLCGRVICQGQMVRALREISSFCIRIAGQWRGAADGLLPHLTDEHGRCRSVLIVGLPGMGKTTFGLAVADQVAQQNGPVLFVSLEMDEEQLAAKRLARAAGISYDALMMGNLGDEERARAAEWSSKVSQIPVYTNRKPRATVDDIANMARKVKGLKLLVVDYFGLIRTEERAKNRYEAMTEVSGQLKALARKLKVPLLCLAQINRENAQRQDKRPQLSDLRDTGALEQDADGVIFLHCNSYYNQERPDPWEPDYMQIILAKNRHASTGTCDAAFYRAVGRIIPAR